MQCVILDQGKKEHYEDSWQNLNMVCKLDNSVVSILNVLTLIIILWVM